ncbi:uncharacterized protein LOC131649301 [Vicia villosa]|uniref:uncharacterized protein LOC131649301 n=1 Tax=Vicia villosa TaxID=3911 RepID=UPI00273AB54C|nr:uncharacterized protein LOC131649301 [Vicia villosa]
MEDNIDFDATKIGHLDAENDATKTDHLDDENVDSVNNNREDILYPRIWDSLESEMIDLLATKGPKRYFSIVKDPKDKSSREFMANLYIRVLSNAEKWIGRGQLASEGFGNWAHVGKRLREHETCMKHVKNMTTWCELRQRINGNFLGLIEMLAEFDPIVQEHVRRITNDNLHVHFFGHNIQNELLLLLSSAIKNEIIRKTKQEKYFSVILDCTPDVSHQEQMSLIIRYVDVSSNSVSIEESFLGFLNVNDTSGQGLFDVLQDETKNLDLNIFDVRGQGYDNGSNMKGKYQCVQKKFVDMNPRAFYIPCGCPSLNLTLCDTANSCIKAKDFFGVVQYIYIIFANSTKR